MGISNQFLKLWECQTNFGNYGNIRPIWEIMGILDQFWEYHTILGNYGKMKTGIGNYGNNRKLWEIMGI